MIKSKEERIVDWNESRGLTTFNADTENRLFAEEVEEFKEASEAGDTYEMIDALCDMYVVFIGTLYKELTYGTIEESVKLSTLNLVTCNGIEPSVTMLGYDFDEVMDECLKEIESRKGRINSQGKFQKYIEGDAEYVQTYKADYRQASTEESE